MSIEEARLAEVAEVVMGQSPPGATYNNEGAGLPFLQGAAEFGRRHPSPQKHCSAPQKVAQPGDLLLSVRAPVGRMNFAHERVAIGRGLAVIRARGDMSTEFLALALEAELPQLMARSGAGMFQSITGAALKDIEVPLPPVGRQQEIVRTINAAESAVAAASRYTEAVARLRSTLREQTMQDLRATSRESALADLGTFARGGSFPRNEQGSTAGDHPVFKVNDMNRDGNERGLRQPENWVTEDQRVRLKMKLWPAGTVVFARVGAALMGDRRRLLVRPSVLDDNMFGLVPDPDQVAPYYLMLVLESVPLSMMAQQGAVPSINARMVGSVSVPVPRLATQREVGKRFRALDRVDELGRVRLQRAEQLRGSLLAHHFSPGAEASREATAPQEIRMQPA